MGKAAVEIEPGLTDEILALYDNDAVTAVSALLSEIAYLHAILSATEAQVSKGYSRGALPLHTDSDRSEFNNATLAGGNERLRKHLDNRDRQNVMSSIGIYLKLNSRDVAAALKMRTGSERDTAFYRLGKAIVQNIEQSHRLAPRNYRRLHSIGKNG